VSASALAYQELEPHRRALWTLAYRMTGVAADADEVVQDTFERALTTPPADRSRELLPWLVRVAMNRSRDVLRARKRDGYVGTWLPSPIDASDLPDEALSPGARYTQLESVSFAFVLALEALSATQRSVVILRDVLDYSVRETAELLELSEVNVKTTHHRARAKLEAGYDSARPRSDPQNLAIARGAMARFLLHVALHDIDGLEQLLSARTVGLNDGGGEFFAAQRPITSPQRVARFYVHVANKTRVIGSELTVLNGLPALLATNAPSELKLAPRSANLFEVDREGQLAHVYSVLAPRKIAHLFPSGTR
jgi:RNA polymerase sigma-70 factor (ECF subfamily)